MKYLLDTCVISELVKSKPDKKVVSWIKKNDEDDLCLSSLTFGELYKGIAKLPDSTRREKLSHWIEHDLKERFAGKIFAVDRPVAKTWGEIQGASETAGNPMPAIESLIAAIGLTDNLIVVTRNVAGMRQSGVTLLNPWE